MADRLLDLLDLDATCKFCEQRVRLSDAASHEANCKIDCGRFLGCPAHACSSLFEACADLERHVKQKHLHFECRGTFTGQIMLDRDAVTGLWLPSPRRLIMQGIIKCDAGRPFFAAVRAVDGGLKIDACKFDDRDAKKFR